TAPSRANEATGCLLGRKPRGERAGRLDHGGPRSQNAARPARGGGSRIDDMRVIVAGAGGRMGRALTKLIAEMPGLVLSGAVEPAESPLIGEDALALAGLPAGAVLVSADMAGLSGQADAILDFTTPAASVGFAAFA